MTFDEVIELPDEQFRACVRHMEREAAAIEKMSKRR